MKMHLSIIFCLILLPDFAKAEIFPQECLNPIFASLVTGEKVKPKRADKELVKKAKQFIVDEKLGLFGITSESLADSDYVLQEQVVYDDFGLLGMVVYYFDENNGFGTEGDVAFYMGLSDAFGIYYVGHESIATAGSEIDLSCDFLEDF